MARSREGINRGLQAVPLKGDELKKNTYIHSNLHSTLRYFLSLSIDTALSS